MTKVELKQRLIKENIPDDVYCLNGGLPNEVLCLGQSEEGWEVYYSKRGIKTDVKNFNTEEDAWDYYLIKILKSMGIIW